MVGVVQIPAKFVMMDVVIANVPRMYNVLLSRHWGTFVGVRLRLGLSYATITIFVGKLTNYIYNPR